MAKGKIREYKNGVSETEVVVGDTTFTLVHSKKQDEWTVWFDNDDQIKHGHGEPDSDEAIEAFCRAWLSGFLLGHERGYGSGKASIQTGIKRLLEM